MVGFKPKQGKGKGRKRNKEYADKRYTMVALIFHNYVLTILTKAIKMISKNVYVKFLYLHNPLSILTQILLAYLKILTIGL